MLFSSNHKVDAIGFIRPLVGSCVLTLNSGDYHSSRLLAPYFKPGVPITNLFDLTVLVQWIAQDNRTTKRCSNDFKVLLLTDKRTCESNTNKIFYSGVSTFLTVPMIENRLKRPNTGSGLTRFKSYNRVQFKAFITKPAQSACKHFCPCPSCNFYQSVALKNVFGFSGWDSQSNYLMQFIQLRRCRQSIILISRKHEATAAKEEMLLTLLHYALCRQAEIVKVRK